MQAAGDESIDCSLSHPIHKTPITPGNWVDLVKLTRKRWNH